MIRASLLDNDTTPCDLVSDCEDAWNLVGGETQNKFDTLPFSKQIQGWVNLFWFLIALHVVANWYEHFRATGSLYCPRSWRLLHHGYSDLKGLFVADVLLNLYTFLSVPLQLLMAKGILPPVGGVSWAIRHSFAISTVLIATAVCWMKQWPGLQVATYLMHACVLFMKVHSYLDVNQKMHLQVQLEKRRKRKDPEDYPNNVTLANFTDFLLVPTIIYSPIYPRTQKIRWSFVFDRTVGGLVIVSILYALVENFVWPRLRAIHTVSLFDTFARLLLPVSLSIILLFFLVFEYILNWFAEVTRFADRHFYDDWWNSLDYAEFSRKWNRPIHKYFQMHVYLACRQNHGWGKGAAAFWTFFFSSVLHELIMSMAAGKLRLEFFCSQMLQIPLIWTWTRLGLNQYTKGANIFFWMGTMMGSTALIMNYAWHAS